MTTSNLEEVIEFLVIAEKQGFLNDNTVQARRTACNKLFSVLDEDQKTVEYVRDNLDLIKTRFQNLNKEVRGGTVEEYGRRVQLVLNDYAQWKTDRSGWERDVGARGARESRMTSGDTEKKPRSTPRAEKSKQSPSDGAANNGGAARVVTFPLRQDFEVSVGLPRDGITVSELKRLLWFLLPYARDWEPTTSPRVVFPMLESNGEETLHQ